MQQQLTLSLFDPIAHQLKACLVIDNDAAATLTLALPRWIPGSYLLRDFAKHITQLVATDAQGNQLTLTRLDLSRWQLDAPAGKVFVNYNLYAYDASVRANYFCPSYAFINPAATALYVEQWRDQPYQLSVQTPSFNHHWQVHTTLGTGETDEHGFGDYHATRYDDLIEHPLLIAKGDVIDWQVGDIPHRMVLVDEVPLTDVNTAKIAEDLSAICSAQHDFWGNPPYPNYLFQVMVSADGYGGLEHTNSTALMISRANLPRQNHPVGKPYEDLLGLCSHEYFHAWLVKRIKPSVLLKPNLHNAVLTPLLWVFEGFTSLYDDWFLYRSGRIDAIKLCSRWSDSITRTLTTTGGTSQSLADASTEAWIKFYQPNENTPNSGISYYTRGAVVALLLLVKLHQHGKHLDDLLQLWWQQWQSPNYQGLSEAALQQDLTRVCPLVNWSNWLDQQVNQPNPEVLTQLQEALATLECYFTAKEIATIGAKVSEENNSLIVKQVTSNSAAHRAGLQVGDELIAINGWRIRTTAQLEQRLQNWLLKDDIMALNVIINHKGFLSGVVLMPSVEATSFHISVMETESTRVWLKG
jgi:predicted metalloprotease with PDZ domain